MTKEDFLIQYVLNRAVGHTGGLDPLSALRSAIEAWSVLQEELRKDKNSNRTRT